MFHIDVISPWSLRLCVNLNFTVQHIFTAALFLSLYCKCASCSFFYCCFLISHFHPPPQISVLLCTKASFHKLLLCLGGVSVTLLLPIWVWQSSRTEGGSFHWICSFSASVRAEKCTATNLWKGGEKWHFRNANEGQLLVRRNRFKLP